MYDGAIAWQDESSYPRAGDGLAGRYTLGVRIGDHGGAASFLASDAETGEQVVVTVFAPDSAHLHTAYAQAVAAAAHDPGLVLPRFAAQQPGEPAYCVTEPPVGWGLDELLAQAGRLPWPRMLAIAARVLEILVRVEAVTRVGHGALIPGSVRVGDGDAVVLTDYGVAALAEDEGAEDVHALAAIVFAGICGRPPVPGEAAQLREFVAVPEALDRLIARALAPDSASRPGLAEMLAEVRRIGAASAVESPARPVAEVLAGARPAPQLAALVPAESTLIVPDESSQSPEVRTFAESAVSSQSADGVSEVSGRPARASRTPRPKQQPGASASHAVVADRAARPDGATEVGQAPVLPAPVSQPDDERTRSFMAKPRPATVPPQSGAGRPATVPPHGSGAGLPRERTQPLATVAGGAASSGRHVAPQASRSLSDRPTERTALQRFAATPAAQRLLVHLLIFNTMCAVLLVLLHLFD